jgi:hypothetical protein
MRREGSRADVRHRSADGRGTALPCSVSVGKAFWLFTTSALGILKKIENLYLQVLYYELHKMTKSDFF